MWSCDSCLSVVCYCKKLSFCLDLLLWLYGLLQKWCHSNCLCSVCCGNELLLSPLRFRILGPVFSLSFYPFSLFSMHLPSPPVCPSPHLSLPSLHRIPSLPPAQIFSSPLTQRSMPSPTQAPWASCVQPPSFLPSSTSLRPPWSRNALL